MSEECECEEEWEEEEERRGEERGAEVASKNKNPTLRMWGITKFTRGADKIQIELIP